MRSGRWQTPPKNQVAAVNPQSLVGAHRQSASHAQPTPSSTLRTEPSMGCRSALTLVDLGGHAHAVSAAPAAPFRAHVTDLVVRQHAGCIRDEVDENGDPVYQKVDQATIIPFLTAALKEALERIETLEAKYGINT